jgi:hypothetical protein
VTADSWARARRARGSLMQPDMVSSPGLGHLLPVPDIHPPVRSHIRHYSFLCQSIRREETGLRVGHARPLVLRACRAAGLWRPGTLKSSSVTGVSHLDAQAYVPLSISRRSHGVSMICPIIVAVLPKCGSISSTHPGSSSDSSGRVSGSRTLSPILNEYVFRGETAGEVIGDGTSATAGAAPPRRRFTSS